MYVHKINRRHICWQSNMFDDFPRYVNSSKFHAQTKIIDKHE